jgi:hypothetical protein
MKKLILSLILLSLIGCSHFNMREREFKWMFSQSNESKQCS